MNDLLIILPALNEALNIGQTLTQIRAVVPDAALLVIDDGSADGTAQAARDCGAQVLRMPYNVGIGSAVQTGLRYAMQEGYQRVVRLDGDGQHDPASLPVLLARLAQGDVNVVVGSRYAGVGDYQTPRMRRFGALLLTRLIRLLTGWRVTDPVSGYAAFDRRAIVFFAHNYPHDYPEPESIVLMHRAGLRYAEVPADFRARQHGRSSITPLRSAYYMMKVMLAICVERIRPAPPHSTTIG